MRRYPRVCKHNADPSKRKFQVKTQGSSELDRRQRRIQDRLSRASRPVGGGAMLAGGNERFEVSRRVQATSHGGIGLLHRLVRQLGLPDLIDEQVQVFRGPSPYLVSDHVLNIAYNVACGGRTLDDLESRRCDEAFMDALGATRLPDPTTAGDFLRRFDRTAIDDLSEAINAARTRVWRQQDSSFFERAVIDVDGTIVGTNGECKEGMEMSYKGVWGFAPLILSLANTGEILYTRNRPGNRPSHDGCFDYLDPAVDVVREGGFKQVRLRGDGHFALSENFDHWCDRDVEFVFGLAAHPKLVTIAEGLCTGAWTKLRREGRTKGARAPKPRVKQAVVEERGYKDYALVEESYAEFEYRPTKCERTYRVIVLRKAIDVRQGQALLIPEVRFHFYITNVTKSALGARQVIREANDRCNQENLIEQTKNGVHAMRMPCDTLLANDVYMVAACLAWNIKAWAAQLWPDAERGSDLARMEFRRFVASVVAIPCQVVRTARGLVYRVLAYSPWVEQVMRAHQRWKRLAMA